MRENLFHAGVYSVVVMMLFVLGVCLIGVGAYRAIRHEAGGDTWSYKRGARKGHTFSVAGNVAWVAGGAVFLVVAFILLVNYLVPSVDAVLSPITSPSPSPSDPSTTEPVSPPDPSTTEPVEPPDPIPTSTTRSTEPVVFKTPHIPHGVVCATYRKSAGMGCVVTDHSNKGGYGRKGCKILFTVSASGATDYEQCPKESDLRTLLYGYPFKGKATSYGHTFDMGVASCKLASDYTQCTDPDTGDVLLRLNDARSTPTVN